MTPVQVYKFFGESYTRAAAALGVTPSAVWQWVKAGKIHKLRQADIQLKTKGKLKAD